MLTPILKKLRRRCLAMVTAIAVVAGCVIVASTPPVSAQTTRTAPTASRATPAIPSSSSDLCLANANASCVGVPIQDIFDSVIKIIDSAPAWILIYWKWKSMGEKDGGQQGEEQDTGSDSDGDPDAGLCLADTGGDAFMTSCGADGTVWIAIPHNDGYWLYSRYTVDEDNSEVLTSNTTGDGAQLFVTLSDANSGGPWQTWNWYSTSHT
jgi:hypothetical protein